MDFLKRAADALTHAEERAAANALKDEKKTEVTVTKVTPTSGIAEIVADVTDPLAIPVTSETAEITTLKAATVDVVSRAPVIEETIIQEQKESMSTFPHIVHALSCTI